MATPVSLSGVWMLEVAVAERPVGEGDTQWIYANYVTPGWFETLGTRLIAGRGFTPSDGEHTPLVAIVNEAFVDRFLDGRSPLESSIRSESLGASLQIVGMVEDVVYRSQREPMAPMVYLPLAEMSKEAFAHNPPWPVSVGIRTEAGSPAALTRSVVTALNRIDPDFSLSVRPISDQADSKLVQERFLAILSSAFGVLALLIAGLGLFAMTSYAVAQRRAEVGIRMVMGAAPEDVVWLVLRRVGLLVGLGVAFGGALSFWAAPLIQSLLFGLEPRDPLTFVGAAAILVVVGALAGWLPARSASRTDPKTTLTYM
jgi:hypothetical protein